MLKLTGLNVELIFGECLTSPIDKDFEFYDSLNVSSISGDNFILKLSELEKHRYYIESFFKQIDGFENDNISWENLINDRNGSEWGHYHHIQHLTAMGYGLELIEDVSKSSTRLYPEIRILKRNFENSINRDATKIRKLSDFGVGLEL